MWPRGKVRPLDLSLVRFLIVGFANTLVGVLVIYAGKWFISLDDVAANMIGYGCGLVVSFVLNKRWSFCYKGSFYLSLSRFLLVILVAYFLNLSLTLVAINRLGINSYLSQALGVLPYTVITYLGSRYFVFRDTSTSQEGAA